MAFEAFLGPATWALLAAAAALAWRRFLRPSGPWRWFFGGTIGFVAFIGWPAAGWEGLAMAIGAMAAGVAALIGGVRFLGMFRRAEG